MYCTECRLKLPYDKAPHITQCTNCGTRMTPEVKDILQHGQYDIAREVRPTQIEMAKDIEALLQEPTGTLLAEGGTGIGKSFAYLIPLLLSKGKRIVISTAKKTLQDQLAKKDIPFLLNKMGLTNISYGIYKGKANYACWLLAKEVPIKDRAKFVQFVNKGSRQAPADIATWLGSTPQWWNKVAATDCVRGKRCPHFEKCLPQPKDYNIIVTNHHLMAIDLKIYPGTLFGEYNTLVIDEAHQAPDAFRAAYSKSMTSSSVTYAQRSMINDDDMRNFFDESGVTTSKAMLEKMHTVIETYEALHRKVSVSTGGATIVDTASIKPQLAALLQAASALSGKLFLMGEELNNAFEETQDGAESDSLLRLMSRLTKQEKRITGLTEFIMALPANDEPEGDKTVVVTGDDKGLYLQPIKVGDLVKQPLKMAKHKIMVSATLAMGSDFEFTKSRLGLEGEPTTDKIYKSPFNLREQAILYLPRHMPLPAHAGQPREREVWIKALSTEIAQLVGATQGDAFVLFSAKTDMKDVLYRLGSHFWNDTGLNLVTQEGDATATLDKYMETPRSVLFGLKSFWEGIDVSGDKLKLVIIPKLPFPNPKDPLIGALCDQAGTQSFQKVMIPHMFFDMKQGVGRLIRTQTDKGFVAILDPRVWTGTGNPTNHIRRMEKIEAQTPQKRMRMGYGKQLLNVLGFPRITDDFTILQDWVIDFFKTS